MVKFVVGEETIKKVCVFNNLLDNLLPFVKDTKASKTQKNLD